jgi:hypothetical protein
MTDGELKILNRGVDTLLVNYKFANEEDLPTGGQLSEATIDTLNDYQQQAKQAHALTPTDLTFSYFLGDDRYTHTLSMYPHGSGIFSWILTAPDSLVKFYFSHGTLNGDIVCQVRFSAFLLWTIGPHDAIVAAESALYDLLREDFHKQVSEIHLCVDFMGWDVSSLDWQHCFVSRVVVMRDRPELPEEEELAGGMTPQEEKKLEETIKKQIAEGQHIPFLTTEHRKIATIDFGSHGSRISAQIYNKLREVKKRKKDYFYPLWRARGWDGESTVWRLEFRLKRKFLSDFELNDPWDILSRLEQLWRYCTEEWLRYVDPSSLSIPNVSRRPTHPMWEQLQVAYAGFDLDELIDPEEAYDARLEYTLVKKPEQVIEAARGMVIADSLPLVDQLLTEEELAEHAQPVQPVHTLNDFKFAVLPFCCYAEWQIKDRQTVFMEMLSAVREEVAHLPEKERAACARHELSQLPKEWQEEIIDRFAPVSFRVVQGTLMKRSRRMAQLKGCIAASAGYLRSAIAFAVGGVADRPDLLASVLWLADQIATYDKQKNRKHLEEVWNKRLAYGFITAQQLEEERVSYGAELHKDDWEKLDAHLKMINEDIRKDKESWFSVA